MTKKVKKWSACMIATLFVISAAFIPKVNAAIAVETDRACSVEFSLTDTGYDELKDGMFQDIKVDLYKVASMNTRGEFQAEEGYSLSRPINSDTTAADWEAMAAEAAVVAKDQEVTASGTVGTGIKDLEVGLYLIVAQDAQSAEYNYQFQPYLISLPNNYYSAEVEGSSDDWVYDVKNVSLKPERTDRYGDLLIEKVLNTYNATVGGAAFVFQVEAVKDYKATGDVADEQVVYSDVVSLNFDAAGAKQILIPDLPAGAKVTVSEIYQGGSYEAVGDTVKQVTILAKEEDAQQASEPVTVSFENTYDNRLNGGTSVVNHFENGENGWEWTQQDDSEWNS